MIDPNFSDPEKARRLHTQKLEVMKILMSEIIDNPGGVKVDELQQVINFLDKPQTPNDWGLNTTLMSLCDSSQTVH